MSEEIIRFNYNKLYRGEQRMFNQQVIRIVKSNCGDCGKPLNQFIAADEQFSAKLLEWNLRESISRNEEDDSIDRSWKGLRYQIKASQSLPELQEAADIIAEVFDRTPNPTALSYENEAGAITSLVDALNAVGEEKLEAAHVLKHVRYLESCLKKFIQAHEAKIEAQSHYKTGEIQKAMKNCYDTWQDLAKYLEAMSIAEMLPGADEAIRQLNAMNRKIKSGISRRLKSSSAKDAEKNILFDENGQVIDQGPVD